MGRKKSVRRWALAACLFGCASGLLVLSAPRFQASLLYLPVDTAISRYYRDRIIPAAQLAALSQRAQQAIDQYPHYRYYDGLSHLHYLEALSPDTPVWLVPQALNRSSRAAESALLKAPAKPRTWLRLAQVRAALGAGNVEVVGPLKMSVLSGRVEPELLLPRLELGYRYLEGLDREALNLWRDQTLLSWRVNPRGVRRALREGRLDLSRVKSVLGKQNSHVIAEMETSS